MKGVDNGGSVPFLFQHPPPCPHLLGGQGQAGIQGLGWAGGACYGSISTSSPPFQKEEDGVLRKGGRAQPGSLGSPEPASSLHQSQEQPSGNQAGILSPAPLGGERSLPGIRCRPDLPGMFPLGLVPAAPVFVYPGRVPGNSEGFRTRSPAPACPPGPQRLGRAQSDV